MNKWPIVKTFFFLAVIVLCAGCLGSQHGAGELSPMLAGKLPLVYSPDYSIELMGLEKLHPFDTAKYKRVYEMLLSRLGLKPEQFYTPQAVTEEQLLLVHSKKYLEALKDPSVTARIAEVPEIAMIPPHLIEESIYRPMKLAAGGTILASSLALTNGWAINFSGGYHHAKQDSGGGFCYFADIPIAVKLLWKKNPELRVLIIDCDAHQGNGYESVFRDDPRIFVYDVYNRDIYPMDTEAAQYIDYPHPVRSGTADEEYLDLLKKTLPGAITSAAPDLVIYNAGTDIFAGDDLGLLSISQKGIIERDSIVFSAVMSKKIPVCMLFSGGYSKKSAEIIFESLENLLSAVIPEYSVSE